LNRETKVRAINAATLYTQHPFVLRFRGAVLHSHLGGFTAIVINTGGSNYGRRADPFSWRLASFSPSVRRAARAKKALEKKLNKQKEEGGVESGRYYCLPSTAGSR